MELIIVKINFWDFFPNLFSNLLSIRKNNLRKAFSQFAKIILQNHLKLNYFENLKSLPCPRTPPHLWMVSLKEYLICLINPLTHFKSMLHFFQNKVVGLHAEYLL